MKRPMRDQRVLVERVTCTDGLIRGRCHVVCPWAPCESSPSRGSPSRRRDTSFPAQRAGHHRLIGQRWPFPQNSLGQQCPLKDRPHQCLSQYRCPKRPSCSNARPFVVPREMVSKALPPAILPPRRRAKSACTRAWRSRRLSTVSCGTYRSSVTEAARRSRRVGDYAGRQGVEAHPSVVPCTGHDPAQATQVGWLALACRFAQFPHAKRQVRRRRSLR
jgi:hypothetical protein